jgi:hypothetical protein
VRLAVRCALVADRDVHVDQYTVQCTIAGAKTLYQRQIEATDGEVDALVCELYGLTPEEIAIVEARDH